jgi:hypothetical protein
MAIKSAKFVGLNYNVGSRKYSVKLELEVGDGKTSVHESAAVWDSSGDAAEAAERAIAYFYTYAILPDMNNKW